MLLVGLIALGMFFLPSCGGDDGGEVTGQFWTGECPDGWSASGNECVYDGTTHTTSFTGTIVDFMTRQPINNAKIQVLDNATGAPLPVGAVSSNGSVTVTGIPADVTLIGLKNTLAPGNKDTYQFNMSATAQDETLWLVSDATYTLAPSLAGVTLDTTKGVVAGGLYFVNDLDEEEPVGCGTVTTTPSGVIRYFDDTDMPTTITNRDSTNPLNGFFLAANINTGTTTVSATVDGDAVGSTTIITYPDSICISNIYVTTATNPQPANCQ